MPKEELKSFVRIEMPIEEAERLLAELKRIFEESDEFEHDGISCIGKPELAQFEMRLEDAKARHKRRNG